MSLVKLAKLLSLYENTGRFAEADNIAGVANFANAVNNFITNPNASQDLKINLLNLGKTLLANPMTGDQEKSEINNLLELLKSK